MASLAGRGTSRPAVGAQDRPDRQPIPPEASKRPNSVENDDDAAFARRICAQRRRHANLNELLAIFQTWRAQVQANC
jgi:hypothetical protein